MITACMDDWSAYVNVYGHCNADWRYQTREKVPPRGFKFNKLNEKYMQHGSPRC